MKIVAAILFSVSFLVAFNVFAEDMSLFDGHGEAAAYVSFDDGLTIYLWDGKPVAYLDEDRAGGFNVYGFNGTHLGWFVDGILRDHTGDAACVIREVLQYAPVEPYKSFKQFKPFKSFQEFAPIRPFFSPTWSDTPCRVLLELGRA